MSTIFIGLLQGVYCTLIYYCGAAAIGHFIGSFITWKASNED